jgi:hypothetical protein
MGFTYTGTVKEITQPLADVLPAYQAGQQLPGTPLSSGTVVVQGFGSSADITAGAFSVAADDDPAILAPYSLAITAALPDAPGDAPAVVYGSPGLFRTGTGWTESGLDIYLRVLDESDLFTLAAAGIPLALPIPYATLQEQAAASAPAGISITQIQGVNGLLSVSIKRGDLTGSFTASMTPDTSPDYASYVVLTLVDLNLDGIEGWIAEFQGEDVIRANIQTALNGAAESLNIQLAEAIGFAQGLLPKVPPSVLTMTLLDITAGPSGVNATPVLGVIQNAVPDPCQALRDTIAVSTTDLATAGPDGWSNSMIAGAEQYLYDERVKLASCVASHQSGPTQVPPTSTTVVQGTGPARIKPGSADLG